jgi:hypothetical protein
VRALHPHHFKPNAPALLSGLTVCGCSLFGPLSLKNNKIGTEGAKHIGEALKINKALAALKCALASPQLKNALAFLWGR